MNNVVKDSLMVVAAGAAGYFAYQMVSPAKKNKMTREMKRTVADLGDVKEDLGRVAMSIKD